MKLVIALLVLVGAGLASLIAVELSPAPVASDPASAPAMAAAALPPAAPETPLAPLIDTLLARPLFSQTRRPPSGPGQVAPAAASATPLPRMTAILIDGPRRSAIFAPPGGKPSVVAEGGHIGPFTIQTIEPQQVIVMGPEGKRAVRTSFDKTLQPPPMAAPLVGAVPQFPGIAMPGTPPSAPSTGYALPQTAGAAR